MSNCVDLYHTLPNLKIEIMNNFFVTALAAMALAAAMTLTGCGTDPGPEPEPQPVKVESVTLDKTTLELTEGETATLAATVAPAGAADKSVAWSSSNQAVATVDATGKVTAEGEGTAVITVTTTDGAKTATCAVTVAPNVVAVVGVTLDKETLSLIVGDTGTLAATVAPDDATDKAVAWSSSDQSVATVDDAGVVTALAPGTATITVTSVADETKTAECVVTVAAPEPDLVDGQVITYMKSTKPREVPLIFIGEGFTAEHMGQRGLYRKMMSEIIDGLFDVEPFKSYKEYFSVYFVAAVGREEGIGTKDNPVDNALGTYMDGYSSVVDYDTLDAYTSKVHLSGEYGAVTVIKHDPDNNSPTNWAVPGYATINLFYEGYVHGAIHELGHAFAFLHDEYIDPNMSLSDEDISYLNFLHTAGEYLNVSNTNDPTKVPWAHFIGHSDYPYVGVYEGALYLKGRWRSEPASIMMDGFSYPPYTTGLYFNAVSRELIVKRIMQLAGEKYSFEVFVAKDKYEPNLEASWWTPIEWSRPIPGVD